ncbi:MAG: hypothetical protein BIFFINMI_01498 [Phycisphaerae bacterium]|nr:hypothetical protein [Phycisphaerae bacterium]
MSVLRHIPLAMLAAATLSAVAARGDGPPATQPAYDGPITPALVESLTGAIASRFRYAWSPPLADRLTDPKAAPDWQVQEQASLEVAKGTMTIKPTDARNAFGAVLRTLPRELRDQPGGRVDIWLTLPAVDANSRLILFLHQGQPQRVAWDFAYYFAYGQNGRQQQLSQWIGNSGYREERWSGPPIVAGQVVHVAMQVVGEKMTLIRDDGSHEHKEAAAIALDDQTRIGLAAYRCQAQVTRIEYRALKMTGSLGGADAWKGTPFAGRAQFEAWLDRRAIPMLGDPSFEARRRAADLLGRLGPLARPSLEKARDATRDPEIAASLAMLLATKPTGAIAPPQIELEEKPAPAPPDADGQP